MPTVTATWNALSGDWFSAGNWDEPNPNPGPPPIVHYVPGANEVAVIPNNSGVTPATPFTVTYNGTSSIDSLQGAESGTLDITGGALTLLNGGAFNSMKINVASGATLTTASGVLVVTGGTYAGTMAGAGSLIQSAGLYTINAGASYTVANWVMGVSSNGNVSKTTLNADLTYANNFTLADYSGNGAIVNLNGHTFTLTGTALFDGRAVGPGALRVTGTAQSGTGYGQLSLSEGAQLRVASGATFTQHHNVQTGGVDTTGSVLIGNGGTYKIDETATLGSAVAENGTVTNNGTFRVDGAAVTPITATVAATMTNNGVIMVAAGDTLLLAGGGSYTLGGAIGGAGKLTVGAGLTALTANGLSISNLSLNGGNIGATLRLDTNISYGGAFSFGFQFDTLQLNGRTLTLSGGANTLLGNQVNGPGTLKITGAATIGGNLALGSAYGGGTAMTLQNAGSITQTGGVSLNGTLQNDAGKIYTISAASTLSSLDPDGATVNNDGTFSVTGAGNSFVDGNFTNVGTVSVASGAQLILDRGTQTLGGALTGAGKLSFGGAANATINTTNVTVASMALAGGNLGATLRLGTDLTYAGEFSFATQFDTLQLNGRTLTLSGASNSLIGNSVNGAGTLRVTGAATIGGNIGLGRANPGPLPMTLRNSGAITQTGGVQLNGTLQNDAGKTYTIATASNIDNLGASGATVLNAGSLVVAGAGTSTISGALTNSGTLQIQQNATLVLNAGVKTLGGTITGAGTLVIGGAADATINTTNLAVANLTMGGGGGKLTLGVDLAYAGKLTVQPQFDQLFLNGHTLTLTGTGNVLGGARYNGGGTIRVNGTATVGSGASFGSSYGVSTPMTLVNAGTMAQNSDISLNGTLQNNTGKSYTIKAAASIYSTGAGGTITNNGTFSDIAAGTSEIFAVFNNVGTLSVSAGATLRLRGGSSLGGTVSGAGGLAVYGSTAINSASVTVGSLAVLGGTTTLGANLTYAGAFTLDQQFATLALNGKTLTLTGTTDFASGTIRGLNGQQDKLVITGAAVDLSTIAFVDWEATDVISITGTSAANTLIGSSKNDTLAGLAGADDLQGGDGIDTVNYAASAAAVRVDLIQLVGTGGDAAGDTYAGIENITGSSKADTLIGSAAANRIEGGEGDDTLAGRGGADALIGGGGIDTVSYGTSAAAVRVDLTLLTGTGGDAEGDTYSGIENINGSAKADTLIGSAGKNRIDAGDGDDVLAGRAGADELIGGTGTDTVSYGTSAAAVRVDLTQLVGTGGDAEGDTYSSIEDIKGSALADTLIGSSGKNKIDAGDGDDVLAGRAGADVLIGGAGSDTASYGTSAAAVTVNLATNANTGGDAAGDSLSSIENVNGSAQSDNLTGNTAANRLDGGLGSDTLTGGGGPDTFAFTTAPGATNIDAITDMTVGSDLISLSTAIYSALQGGPTPGSLSPTCFRTTTQASTSGGLGEIIYNATTGALLYDADGSGAGAAKQFASVSAGLALSASSFRLA